MWKVSRLAIIGVSVALLAACLGALSLITVEWVEIREKLSFLPWNVMVMIVLTMLAAVLSLLVGCGTGIIGVINKKPATVVAIAVVMVAACAVVFIGLYSFSGVAFTDSLLQRGFYELNKKNKTEQINELYDKFECQYFQRRPNATVPSCLDAMGPPFSKYSWVMLAISACLFLLLFVLEMLLSFSLTIETAKPTGFTSIDQNPAQ